jgi:hypothetical protein
VTTADPVWLALYEQRNAREGDRFDLVLDVRPSSARRANPYPAPCVEIFGDDLLADLTWLAVPSSCRLCCVCWSGLRAARCVFHLWRAGFDAYWWALSPRARTAMEN